MIAALLFLSASAQDHWSFRPPAGSPARDIDSFLDAPAPPADRAALLRRVTFDLTGLPPTPEELAAFDGDVGKAADRLLASPAYGEQWARHWLDVARFTETHGFEYNKPRRNAWPYRDWVVDALNADMPYDRFVRLQIAGDALDEPVAAAFLVCGPWDEVGYKQQSALMRARVREEDLEDVVATVSQTFLGLTVNCARCHDHKFAPISQAEYTRLKSVFEGVQPGERSLAPPGAVELKNALRLRARRPGPAPLARWTFEEDGRDSVGTLHAELVDGAKVSGGRLHLNGKGAFAKTAPLARELREKTLEAWVALATRAQGGGSALTVETLDGVDFDAVVYGERQPEKWIAGSGSFRRTRDLKAPTENEPEGGLIHMVVTHAADGTIAVYRNGVPYGEPYTLPPVTYAAGAARVLIGKRHTNGGNPFLAASIEEAALYDRALSAAEVAALSPAIDTVATPEELAKVRLLRDSGYVGTRTQPAPTKRLLRGDVEKPAEVVAPGGLDILGRADWGLAPDAPEAQRRLRFADWVADARNPLTARVIVNRLWHHHFGKGIVATCNDLGPSGERPTHPELLDALALRLVADGWSLKKLHRLIVTSKAYAATREPRRLQAEEIRDALLAVSGLLKNEVGGPSAMPMDVVFASGSNYYRSKDDPAFDRRTLYRFNAISGKDALLEAFDAPDPGVRTPERRTTVTPQQALVLLNDPFVHRAAAAFAGRVGSDVRLAYLLALGRPPTREEAARAEAVARDHGMKTVCWSLFNSPEFIHVR